MEWHHIVAILLGVAVMVTVGVTSYRSGHTESLGRRISEKLRKRADEKDTFGSADFEYVAKAMHSRDLVKLRNYDEHVSEYPCRSISLAIDSLRAEGKARNKMLTPEELDAYITINEAHEDCNIVPRPGYDWQSVEVWAMEHPADVPAMSTIVLRGIVELDQIKELIPVIRDTPSSALSEGAL